MNPLPDTRTQWWGNIGMASGNAQVRLVFILVIMLLVALVTVVNMMMGDYTNLFVGLSVAGAMLYVGTLWRYSWAGAIMVGMLGFSIAPTSFMIPADFMCCGLALGMAVAVLMRRALGAPSPEPVVMPGLGAGGMVSLLLLYFCYLIFQGMYGEMSPVYAGQYSPRNTVKAYAEDLIPVLTLVVLVILRYRLPPVQVLAKWVTPVMIAALIPLCVYRVYQIVQGRFDADETVDLSAVLIPVINLIPNEFTLRVVCPIAAIWAASRLFTPFENISRSAWLLNAFLIVISLSGAVLSAGRAVPMVALFGICVMAFLSRRFGFLLATGGAFILMVVAINLAGPAIYRLPFAMQRSIAMLQFGGSDTKDAIAGSTYMREFLVKEGMKEVRSNSRILVSGRGVLKFTHGDARINVSDQEHQKWMLAVRTGRLHRTSVSQLVRYGIIGVGLYYLAQLAIILYCYKAYRLFNRRKLPEASLAAFALSVMAMNTGIGFLQDAPLNSLTAWFVALVVGVAVKHVVPVVASREEANEPMGRARLAPAGKTGRAF